MTHNQFMLKHFEAAANHNVYSSVAEFDKLIEDAALFCARDIGDTFAVFRGDEGFIMIQAMPVFKPGSTEPSGLAAFAVEHHTRFADAVQNVADVVVTDGAHHDE